MPTPPQRFERGLLLKVISKAHFLTSAPRSVLGAANVFAARIDRIRLANQ
jgi:hypothetical protein